MPFPRRAPKPVKPSALPARSRFGRLQDAEPADALVVNGVDMSLDVQHPDNGPPVTVHKLIHDRVGKFARMIDGAILGMQQLARRAEEQNDLGACAIINGKLADIGTRFLTAPGVLAIKPERAMVDLEQFTPETQALARQAFEAMERELRAKEGPRVE